MIEQQKKNIIETVNKITSRIFSDEGFYNDEIVNQRIIIDRKEREKNNKIELFVLSQMIERLEREYQQIKTNHIYSFCPFDIGEKVIVVTV